MKRKWFYFVFCLMLLAAGCQDEFDDEASGLDAARMLTLINELREKGCNCGTEQMPRVPRVVWHEKLWMAAALHSEDMFANNIYSHAGSDGSMAGDRLDRSGFWWKICGENIARSLQTEEEVIAIWLDSPIHCRNLMNPNFRYMGAARVDRYWTLVLANN